jgi:predicted PurR-regulated permease PerM
MEKVVVAVNGVVKGSFLTALTHGVSATIAFFIFGIPAPVIWGVFTVVAALVPVVGIWVSLGSAIIYLLVTGNTGSAIGLAIWAMVSVTLIDNLVGPRIVGGRAKLHPLLVLLSVLGGIKMFGPLGFLIGPITMAIFVTLVEIYREDFKAFVEQ